MQTTRAAQMVAPRRIEWIDFPFPEPGDGEIVVRLEAAAVCGSDLPYFLGEMEHPALANHRYPLPPFYSLHELIGYVSMSRSKRFKEGDRVLSVPPLQKGMGLDFLAHESMTVPIPAGPPERLVLAQPLGTVVHACMKLPNILGQTAVIIGQGPIGQLFTGLLNRMGVRDLIAVDLLPERLAVSRRMGATATLQAGVDDVRSAILDRTHGHGADLVVEAVGYPATLNEAAGLIRRNGTLLAFGVPHQPRYEISFLDFFVKEGRLINSLGPDIQREFPIAVDLIASGRLDVTPIVTHHFPLEEAQRAFSLFAQRTDGVLKAILHGDTRSIPVVHATTLPPNGPHPAQ